MYALMRFHVSVNAGFFVLVCFYNGIFQVFHCIGVANITCFVDFEALCACILRYKQSKVFKFCILKQIHFRVITVINTKLFTQMFK